MEKVRVAMIGCGGFQRYRLGNLQDVAEAEIVALCDPTEEQIRLTKKAHPKLVDLPEFSDHQKLLDEIKPDAIMIATPHTQHVGQIMDGLGAGCHVCSEKPLVTTVADAHKIIAERDRVGKIGMVSYQRHFQPEFRYIKAKIDSGEAGKVQYITVLQSQEWLRAVAGTWRQIHALSGGGQLNDSGSHVLDIILWTTSQSVDVVSAFTDNKGTEVDINSTLSMMFKGGAMGNIAVIGDGMTWHEEITIWCEELAFFVRDGKLTIVDRAKNKFKAETLTGGSTPDKNFIHSILGKVACESPFECGLEVIRLTEAAWASGAAGGMPTKVTG